MSGEGLLVCLEIFFAVYSSCVAFWAVPPPFPAVYIRPSLCIMAPARSADRTTWLMLNCSRRKMCLLINTKARVPVFTVVMVAISYLTNISPASLCGREWNVYKPEKTCSRQRLSRKSRIRFSVALKIPYNKFTFKQIVWTVFTGA